MFQNITDNHFLSILHSCVKKPLSLWEKKIRNGHIRRITDNDLQSQVLEVIGSKINGTYITCPGDVKRTLGVRYPVLVITVKNLNKSFAFDVQVLDEKNVRRRFRVSTLTLSPEVKPFSCKLPLVLEEGWNQIVFSLQEFTKRIYNTNYTETLRIQIYPNCRIRRVYFTNKLSSDAEFLGNIHNTSVRAVHLTIRHQQPLPVTSSGKRCLNVEFGRTGAKIIRFSAGQEYLDIRSERSLKFD